MESKISKESIVYNGFLKVMEAQVSYESFESSKVITATRECLERGDSVAILLYESDTDNFIFTKQYRYPSARRDQPWMLELVAGSIDDNESSETAIKRECLEEIGYGLQQLELIHTFFPSPGGCSEQIHLFYSEVTSQDRVQDATGSDAEKEDIKLIKIKSQEARQMLTDHEINNSISLIGLQWYFLNKKA